jgi:hypothetical protein
LKFLNARLDFTNEKKKDPIRTMYIVMYGLDFNEEFQNKLVQTSYRSSTASRNEFDKTNRLLSFYQTYRFYFKNKVHILIIIVRSTEKINSKKRIKLRIRKRNHKFHNEQTYKQCRF